MNTNQFTTQHLVTALIERFTHTNGMDFCSARNVVQLHALLEEGLEEGLDTAPIVSPSTLRLCTYYYMVWTALGECPTYEEHDFFRAMMDELNIRLPARIGEENYGQLVNICAHHH